MRQTGSNFVTNGTTDTAMIRFRREAKAQGYEDDVKLWTCIPSCYSRPFLDAAADVDGTYVTLGYLPFEEANENEELSAFLSAVGESKANGFGALAWQAGVLSRQAVETVVEADGVNG